MKNIIRKVVDGNRNSNLRLVKIILISLIIFLTLNFIF